MNERISYMPEVPCNTGCPRSGESTVVKGLAWVLRRITAQQDGCGYRRECEDRKMREGLGNYRGDQDYLDETYGKLSRRDQADPNPPGLDENF